MTLFICAMPLKKIQEKCTDLRDGRGRTGTRIKVLESPWLWPWIRTWWISSPTFLPMVSLHRGSKQCERGAGSSVTFPAKARESGPWCCGTSTEVACCRRWSGSGTQVLWTYMRVCRAQGVPGEEWEEYGGRTKHRFLVDLSTLWIHFSGTMLFSCFFFLLFIYIGSMWGSIRKRVLWGIYQRRLLGHGFKPIENLY